MKHLYLLRHGKASWELAGELDHQRGLTAEGRAESEALRGAIERLPTAPQLVICSSAQRARETLDAIAPALPEGVDTRFDDRIYEGSPVEPLWEVADGVAAVLLIGHNPSIHDLAVELAASGDGLDKLAAKFPTAALAALEFDVDWRELAADCARLTSFTRSADL